MEALYLATAPQLLEVLHGASETVRSVMLIGHNPGMHELAVACWPGTARDAAQRLRRSLPDRRAGRVRHCHPLAAARRRRARARAFPDAARPAGGSEVSRWNSSSPRSGRRRTPVPACPARAAAARTRPPPGGAHRLARQPRSCAGAQGLALAEQRPFWRLERLNGPQSWPPGAPAPVLATERARRHWAMRCPTSSCRSPPSRAARRASHCDGARSHRHDRTAWCGANRDRRTPAQPDPSQGSRAAVQSLAIALAGELRLTVRHRSLAAEALAVAPA